MITQLSLENFRGFKKHIVPFHPTTIIIGKNNAGKSTIIEALRLISIVADRYKGLNFSDVPRWLDIPKMQRGVAPSLKNIDINLESVFYSYNDPPARIEAMFSSGENITLYIGNGHVHAVISDRNGKVLISKRDATQTVLPKVSILPQISALSREEKLLTPDYVNNSMSSSLSSLHFRNQIHLLKEFYRDFKQISEESWAGLRLQGVELVPGEDNNMGNLSLLVRDGDFTGEIGWMGHGLQMWLQIMWFLTKARDSETVILDEPDVYMHADLQRKLVRFLKGRYPQVIIATHSTEIISEVDPEEILIINRREKSSRFASSLPTVQKMISNMGSVHNIQLARLWNSRRFLMVEGDDVDILKRFQNALYPKSNLPLDIIPQMSIGGWNGWNYAVGSSMFLKNSGGEDIITYCLLDSDYHTDDEINIRLEDAKKRNVQLHVWKYKEIENYLMVPDTICRVIRKLSCKEISSVDEIRSQIQKIIEGLYNEILDSTSSAIKSHHHSIEVSTANKKAREKLKDFWQTEEGRLAIAPGKQVMSQLSDWIQQQYKVSFSMKKLAGEMRVNEICEEIKHVLMAIEKNEAFKID